MREIKFRAWDKDSKLMFEPDAITADGRPVLKTALKNDKNVRVYDCPIMQFTSLQDKNGKDIFEGDIVQSYSHPKIPPLRHAIKWRDEITGWWMYNLWSKDDKDGSTQLWVGMKYGPFEVIGNIHENPELLE